MHPTPPLTDDLRHALSIAMLHPDDWGANEWLEMRVENVQFADMVSPFVVESISNYDDDYIECNGYWPHVSVSFALCGLRVQATMHIKWNGELNLEANPKVAAILKKSA